MEGLLLMRRPEELRPLLLENGVQLHASGSCLVKLGRTHVLCAANLEAKVPGWMKGRGTGWLTAEYGMLPAATHSRSDREAARGKQQGRTVEIQRLIGRSLRQAVDLTLLGEHTLTVDCDVLNADGGTRCAAITGAWVAVALALRSQGLSDNPSRNNIRLNTDLARKSPEYLEYVVLHEMAHLLEPTHNARFTAIMDHNMPNWRQYRDELNRLPLRMEAAE